MSGSRSGNTLIEELLGNPAKFNEDGRAYELLQEYFQGFPTTTLRPLLAHTDEMVRRAAIWVTSDLGRQGCSLLPDAIRLLASGDRYVRYHALEVVMVCSFGGNAHEFMHVVRSLESDDVVIRILSMRLVLNADSGQLSAAVQAFGSLGAMGRIHTQGLSALLNEENLSHGEFIAMLNHEDAVVRKYAAIAAKRLVQELPELISIAKASSDSDVRTFAKEVS